MSHSGNTGDQPKRWSSPATMTSGKPTLNAINGASVLSQVFASWIFSIFCRSAINSGCRRSAKIRPPTPAATISREYTQACHQPKSPPQTNRTIGMKRYTAIKRTTGERKLLVLPFDQLPSSTSYHPPKQRFTFGDCSTWVLGGFFVSLGFKNYQVHVVILHYII